MLTHFFFLLALIRAVSSDMDNGKYDASLLDVPLFFTPFLIWKVLHPHLFPPLWSNAMHKFVTRPT